MDVAAQAHRGAIPNLLFAAVHFLLLRRQELPLADYYPSLREHPRQDAGIHAAFRQFCRDHRAELEQLVRTRYVQTNEVNRSAFLLPAFVRVFELGGRRPLALVDVGASAGLNLRWDFYCYEYGGRLPAGPAKSPLTLRCELRGDALPTVAGSLPPVSRRVGIDFHPIDLHDSAERLWLEALVWPDQPQRRERLALAIAIAKEHDVEMIAGDALDVLPTVLAGIALSDTCCVFHSSAVYQFSDADRAMFDEQLKFASISRDVYRIAAENEQLRLQRFRHGELESDDDLAAFDSHGRWLEWHNERGC